MTTSAFETYLAKVEADYRHGIATEHTYRSTLLAQSSRVPFYQS
jgi:hypothetical protein